MKKKTTLHVFLKLNNNVEDIVELLCPKILCKETTTENKLIKLNII